MKKRLYLIVSIAVVAAATAVSARAQTPNQRLTAQIPFAFNIGNMALPAGEYEVTCTNPASSTKILLFREKNGGTSVLIQTIDTLAPVPVIAKLVFHRYGDRYFLSQAWMDGERTGLLMARSRDEKNVQRRMSGTKVSTATVAMK